MVTEISPGNGQNGIFEWNKLENSTFVYTDYMLGVWENKAVYSRKEVESMLRRGDITESKAEELLNLSYESRQQVLE